MTEWMERVLGSVWTRCLLVLGIVVNVLTAAKYVADGKVWSGVLGVVSATVGWYLLTVSLRFGRSRVRD